MREPSDGALKQALNATLVLLAASAGPMTVSTVADTFGTGANIFVMDFVTIGNPGNAPDTTGYGAVSYAYQMGKYEVSWDVITKANNSVISSGGIGFPIPPPPDDPNAGAGPARYMSWYAAAEFVN